jgi:hypothetical protein
MKIGLSYSRCVRDIVDGTVDINDVLIVIARTNFDPHNDEQWKGIWEGYGGGQTFGSPFSNPEWIDYPAEDEAKFRSVSCDLWDQGKFHQPRKFGAHPYRRDEFWLETCLPSSELERNPAAKIAWNNFQIVAGLTNVKLDKDYQ